MCTQDWKKEDLDHVLSLARDMQKKRFDNDYTELLRNRTFFMFFYSISVRTRQSFECAATELGGHAQFIEPKSMKSKNITSTGETVEDAFKVMSRYACGIGIRILEDKISHYGEGNDLLKECAHWSDIPILSMAHDKFHPCQGLADIMGYQKHLGENLRGKKLLVTWAHGALSRSWCSVQEAILLGSRYGMDVTVAHPEGYALDPEVIRASEQNSREQGSRFTITHDPSDGYKGAHVVYSRNWMSPHAYKNGEYHRQEEIDKALTYTEWICDAEKMKLSENAFFTHPTPIARGYEVTDEVASGPRSIVYDVTENRLHVQKAIMALTMADL
ncbi:MAG: ornithine carbamoyltransferase [Vulcanimicrobiota bacterium]